MRARTEHLDGVRGAFIKRLAVDGMQLHKESKVRFTEVILHCCEYVLATYFGHASNDGL